MPKTPRELMSDRLELYLNELQADMTIFQLVLQQFLMHSLMPLPERKNLVVLLQAQLQETVEKAANVSADPQDGERLKRLNMARLDHFFLPLNQFFGVPLKSSSSGKAH